MIKVTVITTAGKKSYPFEETKTPKDILNYFDIDYSAATNSLDGVKLDVAGMNKSLRELGVGKECRLSSIVKIDNAAKVSIQGLAAVVVSDVKLDDWKRIEKMAPEMLELVDEETDEVEFRICTGEGPGTIDENGVVFDGSANANGSATVTVLLDPELEDKKTAVKDMVGRALLDLNKVEKEVPSILKDINDMEKEIDDCIVEG